MEVIKTVEDWVRLGVSAKIAENLLIKNPDLIDKLQNIDTGDVYQNEINDINQKRLITNKLLENKMEMLIKTITTYDYQLPNTELTHVIPLVVNEVHKVSRQKKGKDNEADDLIKKDMDQNIKMAVSMISKTLKEQKCSQINIDTLNKKKLWALQFYLKQELDEEYLENLIKQFIDIYEGYYSVQLLEEVKVKIIKKITGTEILSPPL
jgi:hypothetical protein